MRGSAWCGSCGPRRAEPLQEAVCYFHTQIADVWQVPGNCLTLSFTPQINALDDLPTHPQLQTALEAAIVHGPKSVRAQMYTFLTQKCKSSLSREMVFWAGLVLGGRKGNE